MTKGSFASAAIMLLVLSGCAEGTLPGLLGCAEGTATCAVGASGEGGNSGAGLGGAAGFAGSAGGSTTIGAAGTSAGQPPAGGSTSGGTAATTGGVSGSGTGGTGGVAASGSAGAAGSPATAGSGNTPTSNLTVGKTATADSEESSNPAQSGNDGNVGTRWCAGDDAVGHHWTVDLGQPHTLASLEVTFEFDGRDYGYVVEGSLDDDDYSTLLDRTDNAKQTQVQTETLSGSARYVRVRFVALPTDTWASFFELKLLGQ